MSRLIVLTLFSATCTFSWAFWLAPIFSTQVQLGKGPRTKFERFPPSEVCVGGGGVVDFDSRRNMGKIRVDVSSFSDISPSSSFAADSFKLLADHEPGD